MDDIHRSGTARHGGTNQHLRHACEGRKTPPDEEEPTLSRVSRATPQTKPPDANAEPTLLLRILTSLEDDKAEDIVTIPLAGRSALCDNLVVATGRSARHVSATAEHLARRLKEAGYGSARVEGLAQGDWVLVDAGDVIVHLFRPEVRAYYDLEGMWAVDEQSQRTLAAAGVS